MKKISIVVLVLTVAVLAGVVVWQNWIKPAPAVNNQPEMNQPSTDINCLKEGESRADDASGVPDKCCAGLVKVESVDEFSPGAICKTADQLTSYDPFRCTACGNGVCGIGENKCNCPADCK